MQGSAAVKKEREIGVFKKSGGDDLKKKTKQTTHRCSSDINLYSIKIL